VIEQLHTAEPFAAQHLDGVLERDAASSLASIPLDTGWAHVHTCRRDMEMSSAQYVPARYTPVGHTTISGIFGGVVAAI
jgi:hypothetical protein